MPPYELATTRSGKSIPAIDSAIYTARHRWRGWNRPVTVLDDIPALTKRSFPGWTQMDHIEAAGAHAGARDFLAEQHGQLIRKAYAKYGEKGPLISGIGQEHFPERIKHDLRGMAHLASRHHEASVAHWHAAKRTHYNSSPYATHRAFVYTK